MGHKKKVFNSGDSVQVCRHVNRGKQLLDRNFAVHPRQRCIGQLVPRGFADVIHAGANSQRSRAPPLRSSFDTAFSTGRTSGGGWVAKTSDEPHATRKYSRKIRENHSRSSSALLSRRN